MTSVALLQTTLRLVLRSWRGQLLVLAFGTLVLAPTLHGMTSSDDLTLRSGVLVLELLVLLGASARAAHAQDEDVLGMRAVDELVTVVAHLPRLFVQILVTVLPGMVAIAAALLLGSWMPLLGLLAIPGAFIVTVLCLGPVLVAVAAVMRGEQRWLPRTAWDAVRPARWSVALDACIGTVVSGITALPLALVAMVVLASGTPIAVLGSGLAGVAVIPVFGCWAVAMWRSLGAPFAIAVSDASDADAPQQQLVRDADALAAAFGQATAPVEAQLLEGPAWDVAVEPGAVWGTWVRLDGAGRVGLRVAFSGSVPPDLLLCGEDGQWYRPGQVTASGAVIMVELPAGNTYLQVGAVGPEAQAISVTMLVPGSAAA